MGARAHSLLAAVAFAAAVAVYAVWRERDRRLRREAVAQQLMAGCLSRDNAALRHELDGFRSRLGPVLARPQPVAPAAEVPAGPAPDDVLACSDSISAPQEGGPTA